MTFVREDVHRMGDPRLTTGGYFDLVPEKYDVMTDRIVRDSSDASGFPGDATLLSAPRLASDVFRNRVDRFDDRTVYAAVLVGVVVSAAVSYRVDVSGIALWVTAFLSTLVPAGAFLAGTLLLERGR